MRRDIVRLTDVVRAGIGRPSEGRALFKQHCANCHMLHGQGGQVGPDLTGYRRDDLPAMLLAVVNPNAEIREGYENYTVTTESGRTVNGLLVEKDAAKIVLRTAEGEKVTIPKTDLAEMSTSGVSLMPPSFSLRPIRPTAP
jgi:putative heme-binding domain-containing protein